MGMMRPNWSKTIARASRRPHISSGAGAFAVEDRKGGDDDTSRTERVVTPAVGETVALNPPGRILEGSVAVRGYVQGAHFTVNFEDTPPSIENVAMPVGRTVEVSYFLDDSEASAQGVPVLSADPASPADGEMWIRIDRPEPEIRVARGGIVFALALEAVAVPSGGGRLPSSTLLPPFLPSRVTPEP